MRLATGGRRSKGLAVLGGQVAAASIIAARYILNPDDILQLFAVVTVIFAVCAVLPFVAPRRYLGGRVGGATVDDFPFNLITKAVPYDPQLAAALANLKVPPVRGGEAMHGLAFIRTAAAITGDARFDDYYRRVLIGQRKFLTAAVEYGSLQDDILAGRNLDKVETILLALNAEIANVVRSYLAVQYGVLSGPAAFAIQLVFDVILKNWVGSTGT